MDKLVKDFISELQDKKINYKVKYEEERTIVGLRLSFNSINFALETNVFFSNDKIDILNRTNLFVDPEQKQEYITMLGKVTALNAEPHILKWFISKKNEVVSGHSIMMSEDIEAKRFVNLLLFLCKETAQNHTQKIMKKVHVNKPAH